MGLFKIVVLALSDDNRLALVGYKEPEECFLVDLEGKHKPLRLSSHQLAHPVFRTAAFSLKRGLALTAGGTSVCLWDLRTGSLQKEIQVTVPGSTAVGCIQELPGGERVLILGAGVLQIYHLETGECTLTLREKAIRGSGMAVSEDGRYALTKGYKMCLWDLRVGRCLRTFSEAQAGWGNLCTAFSADGKYGLSGSDLSKVFLWKLHFPEMRKVGSLQFDLHPIIVKPRSSSEILTIEAHKQGYLQQAQQHTAAHELKEAYHALRQAQALPGFEHDASILDAISSLSHQGRRLALRDIWKVKTLKGAVDTEALVFASRHPFAITAGDRKGGVVKWDLQSGDMYTLRQLPIHPTPSGSKPFSLYASTLQRIESLALSHDDRFLLAGGSANSGTSILFTYMIDLEAHQIACAIDQKGNGYDVSSVFFAAGERLILSDCYMKGISVYDRETGEQVRWISPMDAARLVALSPNSRYLLERTWDAPITKYDLSKKDQPITIFDLYSGKQTSSLVMQSALCEQISADGRFLVIGGEGGVVEVFDLHSGSKLHTWKDHQDDVWSIAISPDSRFVFSAGGVVVNRSKDTTIRVWDLLHGTCLKQLEGHTKRVASMAVSPDGRYLLSGGEDDFLILWELDWEYEFPEPADWDETARGYLESFLSLHSHYSLGKPGAELPLHEKLAHLSIPAGAPTWSEADFQDLLYSLGCAGYGWLKPEGVRKELERMAAERGKNV
jgi:WD40 repeat protein